MDSNIIFYVYFFRRDNKNGIPGFDEISIVALNQLQAARHLTEITQQANEFFYSHKVLFTRTLIREVYHG